MIDPSNSEKKNSEKELNINTIQISNSRKNVRKKKRSSFHKNNIVISKQFLTDNKSQTTDKVNIEKSLNGKDKNKEISHVQNIKGVIYKLFCNSFYGIIPCFKLGKDSKVLYDIKESLYEQLDLFTYLKYIQTVKTLSYLSLNDDENYLFRFLTNKNLILENIDIYKSVTNDKDKNEIDLDEYWNKLKYLLTKNNKTPREMKLCNIICEDINDIIN